MLATLIDEPFDSKEWLFEVKWDGFRALAHLNGKKVQLVSRNNLLFNEKFPSIVKELQGSQKAILDGEIVVVDSRGKSHFQLLQNYSNLTEGVLCYYVFDILYKEGKDLRDLPLIERKEIAKKVVKEIASPYIRYSDHVIGEGKKLFKEAQKESLEGIIAKKLSSRYESARSRSWLKIKTKLRQEFIITGFTDPQGSRKKFGALICAVYDDQKKLVFVGQVGGGFSEAMLDDVYKKLKPLQTKKCPFEMPPKTRGHVTWVKPKLVCEVSFSEWTKQNSLRHPVFQGLREDKNPASIKKEVPMRVL